MFERGMIIMALKKIEQIKDIIKQKNYNISDNTIDDMFKRGFFPHLTDDNGNYVYDDYFTEEKAFNEIFDRYNDTISYYTTSEMHQYLISQGITDISIGAIEKMAREKYIEGYKVDNAFLFKPEIATDVELIKNAFEEMEEKEVAEEIEDMLLIEENELSEDEKEFLEIDEASDDKNLQEFIFEEEQQKSGKKRPRSSSTQSHLEGVTTSGIGENSYEQKIEAPTKNNKFENNIDKSSFPDSNTIDTHFNNNEKHDAVLSEKNFPKEAPLSQEKYYDDTFKQYNAEEDKRRKEQERHERESEISSPKNRFEFENSAQYSERQGHAINDSGKNFYSFTGHEKESGSVEHYISQEEPYSDFIKSTKEFESSATQQNRYKPNSFITKVQISEVAANNVLSQNGINEVIEYSRTYNQEIQIPAKNGSYFKIEPVKSSTIASDQSKNESEKSENGYRVSIVRPNADASKNETEVLYSSVVSENKSDFASISVIYAESMGVESLESGYQNHEQEAIDNKVLYAIGVIPQSQAFAPSKIEGEQKAYTSIQLPDTVEFVHPNIISKLEEAGVQSFYKNNDYISLNSFNKTHVHENSIVTSAYLGSEEYIGKELSKVNLNTAISNSVSLDEYRSFSEKVQVSAVTNDVVLSQAAITHIVDVVKTEKHKIDIPLRNGQLLTFEPEAKSENSADFKVTIYSSDEGDYSKPKSALLYSSSADETQAVNFGNVYEAYAAGMETEKLQSSPETFDEKQNDKKVLYAIGAVSQKEIYEAIDRNGIMNTPKGVSFVHSNLLNKIEASGASKINTDNRTFSLNEYKNRTVEINQNFLNESVYLGNYKDIERVTAKSEASDSFIKQFNIKQSAYVNGRPASQRSVGNMKDVTGSSPNSNRHAATAAIIANGVSAAVKTATLQTPVVGDEVLFGSKQQYINELAKNTILTDKGFGSIIDTVGLNGNKIEVALNDNSVLAFSPVTVENGKKTVSISVLEISNDESLPSSARILADDALLDRSAAYDEYLKAFGIENTEYAMRDIPKELSDNETKLLFALGTVSDEEIQKVVKNGIAELPENVSYLHPSIVKKLENAGVDKLKFGDTVSVNIKAYIKAEQEKRTNSRIFNANSVILTSSSRNTHTNTRNDATIIPKGKGYILSYTDKAGRVNLTMLGTLKDDKFGYATPKMFGVERQIGFANSRIISAYPNIQAVIHNGKIQTVINPEFIKQRHQINALAHMNKEIIRLSAFRSQKHMSEFFKEMPSTKALRITSSQIADKVIRRNDGFFKMLQDKALEPQIKLKAIFEFTKSQNQSEAQADAEFGAGNVLIKNGLREKNKIRQEKDLTARNLRVLTKQLGKMSGLMRSVDYFTTGVNYTFGYTSPIKIIGSLAEHSIAKQGAFDLAENLSASLLIDDLSALVSDDYGTIKSDIKALNTNKIKDSQKDKAIRLHARKLNHEISIRSKTLFGQDITRFTTYKMKSILSEGKFNGSELTDEQRQQLLMALKIKGYSIGDLSVFNIKDNLQKRNIKLSKNYNLSNSNDVRSLLRELDTISFLALSRIFNGNKLSELNDKQLLSLANLDDDAIISIAHGLNLRIDNDRLSLIKNSSVESLKARIKDAKEKLKNANGKDAAELRETIKNLQAALRVKTKADEVQAVSSAYLTGKKSLELKQKEKEAKRNIRGRLSMLAKRAFSNTYMMAGVNAALMPIEYMRMAKFYTQFTVTLTKSVMHTVKRMYKATFQKLWHRTHIGKFIKKKAYDRSARKANKNAKKIQKKTAKAQNRLAKKASKTARFNDKRAKFLSQHPKINKTSNQINKVKDKGRKIKSRFTDSKGKLKRFKNRILSSKPVKFITAPFSLYNKLKAKIMSAAISVLKYVLIAVAVLGILDTALSVIELVMTSVSSTIWTSSDNDLDDHLDDPISSLTKDRVEFCIGMDSALKVYVEAMIDKDNYNWDSVIGKTPVDYILDSKEVEDEKENWFDPNKNKTANIKKLGLEINGIQTGVHYSYYDGDGNEVGLQSNAKDIMSVASTWMYEDYKAKGLFKSYVEKLWNYSHAVTYTPRKYGDNYIYECDLDDSKSPCHENIYEYDCNDKNASIYEKDASGNYITKSLHSNPAPENYSEHGCKQHTVTYCDSSPNVEFDKTLCSNYGVVTAPNENDVASTKEVYYCKGHSDCNSRCKNESGMQVGYMTYHTAARSALRGEERILGYENNSSKICNNTAGIKCTNCSTYNNLIVSVSCGGCETERHEYYCGAREGYYDEEGKWHCPGHQRGVCNNYIRKIANWSEVLFGASPEYEFVCAGHSVNRYICNGHSQTVDKITCDGYCDGHELRYCTGHVDIDVSIVTLFLDDTNGLTKLGVPTSVSFGTETVTEKDPITHAVIDAYDVDIEIPKGTFTSLYENVMQFQNIKRKSEDGGTSLFPLPDSYHLKEALRLKLSEIDNVAVGTNETIDTLRFLYYYTNGKYPYDKERTPKSLEEQIADYDSTDSPPADVEVDFANLDEFVESYFTRFATCWWQDLNDQGSLDGKVGQTVNIQHYAGEYQKFSKYNYFDGFYLYDESGNIRTATVTNEDGVTEEIYLDTGNVGRAEMMYSDDWKELYDIDFPGSFSGTLRDEDKSLLANTANAYHGATDSNAANRARTILSSIGISEYSITPESCVKYAMVTYQGFGKSGDPFSAALSGGDKAVNYLYSGNRIHRLENADEVTSLITGDAVLIGDEVYIVLYNTSVSEGVEKGEIVFATVAGGGTPRLVAFRTEMLTTGLSFGYIKYSECS